LPSSGAVFILTVCVSKFKLREVISFFQGSSCAIKEDRAFTIAHDRGSVMKSHSRTRIVNWFDIVSVVALPAIHFRKGIVVVRVSSDSIRLAERFAKYVEGQIEAN
jgi:hypothetical protein